YPEQSQCAVAVPHERPPHVAFVFPNDFTIRVMSARARLRLVVPHIVWLRPFAPLSTPVRSCPRPPLWDHLSTCVGFIGIRFCRIRLVLRVAGRPRPPRLLLRALRLPLLIGKLRRRACLAGPLLLGGVCAPRSRSS